MKVNLITKQIYSTPEGLSISLSLIIPRAPFELDFLAAKAIFQVTQILQKALCLIFLSINMLTSYLIKIYSWTSNLSVLKVKMFKIQDSSSIQYFEGPS